MTSEGDVSSWSILARSPAASPPTVDAAAGDSQRELPEEARRYKVEAEVAVREERFVDAAIAFEKALTIAPWWPAGHYNSALALSEIGFHFEAVQEMKRYLLLAPDAPNARGAQDKIYEWESKAGR